MKTLPLLDTMVFGVPCNFHMWRSIKSASWLEDIVFWHGMKCAIFVRRSITVSMESAPPKGGKSVMRS